MKVFLICPVREVNKEQKEAMQKHIDLLESVGVKVYYPARDTDQTDKRGINICSSNLKGILEADEVHIYFDPDSKGTLFDLGMAFALNKPLKAINEVQETEGKSFNNLVLDWSKNVNCY